VDAAPDVADGLAVLARAQGHPWGLATATRCRAMIDLAGGASDRAAGLSDAAADYGRLGLEFDRARCLVHLGRLQRRSKKRAEARQALREAQETFRSARMLGLGAEGSQRAGADQRAKSCRRD
jgi:hypothetical protein